MADCPICMEPTESNSQCTLKCGHMLCNRCITQLEKPICPVCREPIFPGRPPPGRAAGPTASASADEQRHGAAEQIQEDARLARRLARDMGSDEAGEGGFEAAETPARETAPLLAMAEAQQFHHIGSRMTYSTF